MRKIIIWKRHNLKDSDLWEQFREEFDEWDEAKFVIVGSKILKEFRAFLRTHDVWVMRKRGYSVVKALFEVLKKDTETPWTEEELASSPEKFNSDVIDHLRKTDFGRNPIDYSWQAAQSRSGSRKSESPKRERSIQPSIQPRSKGKLPFRQRSPPSQPIRQRSPSFHPQNSQNSPPIELQNVQSTDRWIPPEKPLFLEKPRRPTPLRPFTEPPPRSVPAFPILPPSPPPPPSPQQTYKEKPPAEPFKPESFKPTEPIRTESGEHEKELANLAKLYTNEAKYSD
jgi:hypothetical protein